VANENPYTQTKITERSRLEYLRAQLLNERSTFKPHWQDLNDYILPRRGRFFVSDVNKGDRRNLKIIDSTATLAARTLRAGMVGGITSPARPWFRLTTPDPDLNEQGDVKAWLDIVTQRMRTVFLRSNLYNTLPILYGDMGVFGTGAFMVEEDFDTVIRTTPFPIGSYMIANDFKRRVRVFFREWRMTVRQLVEEYGEVKDGIVVGGNLSETVTKMWNTGEHEVWIDVCHCIKANPKYDPKKLESKFKRFMSVTYEKGSPDAKNSIHFNPKDDIFLREKGYDEFPALCGRWEVTGEDVYATDCPGMTALGDIKQLQLGEKRSMQAMEKSISPPVVGPSSLKSVRTSLLPGEMNYTDEREGSKGFRAVYEVKPKIQEWEGKQTQVRQRVSRTFYEDLFLMLIETDRRQITATEIAERKEEKLLALGPVLEQLNQDILDPLIDITFAIMARQGVIPPPPESLSNKELKVEYISIMAQAQKLIGVATIERFAGFVGNIAQQTGDPADMDKVDIDQMIDEYGDGTSVPTSIIRSDEEVEKRREKRAKLIAAQQQMEAIKTGAAAAKDLGEAKIGEDDTALKRLIDQSQAGQIVEGA